MASYQELWDEGKNRVFLERCSIAALVVADGIVEDGAASDAQKSWAAQCFANPLSMGTLAAHIVLAANKDQPIGIIQSATDATLQTAVDAGKAVLVASGV